MIRSARDEEGWAVVVAIVLMTIMLGVGLATLAVVDNQQKQSGNERQRESGLNLNEGVLYAQALVLAQQWPRNLAASPAFPATCSSGAPTTPQCPDRDTLAAANSANATKANFTSADFLANTTWVTKVRDDGGALGVPAGGSQPVYDAASADAAQPGCATTPCTYDANGDNKLWVQARVIVRGHPRSVVALLQLEQLPMQFPSSAITAGHIAVTNNGQHTMIDDTGSQLSVRCQPPSGPGQNTCVDYSKANQISPPNFAQLPAGNTSAMTPNELAQLKATAINNGTYYAGCPPNGNLAGAVVWVESCSQSYSNGQLTTASCQAPVSGQCINQPGSVGMLIWHHGTLSFTGNVTFCGLIYMVNGSDVIANGDSNGTVFSTGGNFSVRGAVAVDGQGGVAIGSNGNNLVFDTNAFNSVKSYGTAGLVQNTWRELPPGG